MIAFFVILSQNLISSKIIIRRGRSPYERNKKTHPLQVEDRIKSDADREACTEIT